MKTYKIIPLTGADFTIDAESLQFPHGPRAVLFMTAENDIIAVVNLDEIKAVSKEDAYKD